MKKYGYDEIGGNHEYSIENYNKDITNKIGIYGYLGRIPTSMIDSILIHTENLKEYQDIFNRKTGDVSEYDEHIIHIDFDDISEWNKIDKNKVLPLIKSIEIL